MSTNKQMVGVFDSLNAAERARDDVKAAGVDTGDVRVISPDDIRDNDNVDRNDSEQSMMDQVSDFFASIFGTDDEDKVSERYLQAVRSGSSLVVVDSDDDALDRSRIDTILQAGTQSNQSTPSDSATSDRTSAPTSHTADTAQAGTSAHQDDPADRDTINAGTDEATGARNRNEMV